MSKLGKPSTTAQSLRPMTAHPKSLSRMLSPLTIGSPSLITTTAPSTATNIGMSTVDLLSKNPLSETLTLDRAATFHCLNSQLSDTVDRAVDYFLGDRKKQGGAAENAREADDMRSVDSELPEDNDNEVVNNETYAEKKKLLQDLTRELAEKLKRIERQKSMAQRLERQVRVLKTDVQDPLEIESQYKNKIQHLEHKLKELQVKANMYKESYVKEAGDRDLNHRVHINIMKQITEDVKSNGKPRFDCIKDWMKFGENYKASLTQSAKQQSKVGVVDERDVAERNRLAQEIDIKELEKKRLQREIEIKRLTNVLFTSAKALVAAKHAEEEKVAKKKEEKKHKRAPQRRVVITARSSQKGGSENIEGGKDSKKQSQVSRNDKKQR